MSRSLNEIRLNSGSGGHSAADDKLSANPFRFRTMGVPVPGAREYRFDPYTLDARTGELTNAGHRTLLREQPFLLLLALLERPGDLVTREELIRRLWPEGTFVDFDRGLNKAVNHLRDTLGDSAEHPRFVETLPRKGYRFIAPVSPDQQELKEGLSPLSSDPSDRIQASPRRPHRWFLLASAILIVLTILL